MESAAGVQGIQQMSKDGTPVEVLEGDGDNTLIAKLRSDHGINMKKCLDKNHVIKNIDSLDFCVQTTSAFINDGRSYIAQWDERRKIPSYKRRRLQLKEERSVTQCANKSLEGDTYQSEIGLEENIDTGQIPEAIPKGLFKKLEPNGQKVKYITFGLETTGLIRGQAMPHITQITARVVDSSEPFNSYILPTIAIEEEAAKITGIHRNSSGELIVNGNKKDAVSTQDGLNHFCKFLEKHENPILIAHNGRKFDFPVLVTAAKSVNMLDQLFSCAFGCVESLNVFRKAFPNICQIISRKPLPNLC
ncbi:uncharacterized protein LOC117344711 [Pecten maximus]|uniref:uncharacterized protein LOC117344711 n=1 Tax=Pecten maximus TaxID=6579 RepID=UPI001458ACFA|nr:uncharacterized protein LOC117344711 [Pecten maximus]